MWGFKEEKGGKGLNVIGFGEWGGIIEVVFIEGGGGEELVEES